VVEHGLHRHSRIALRVVMGHVTLITEEEVGVKPGHGLGVAVGEQAVDGARRLPAGECDVEAPVARYGGLSRDLDELRELLDDGIFGVGDVQDRPQRVCHWVSADSSSRFAASGPHVPAAYWCISCSCSSTGV